MVYINRTAQAVVGRGTHKIRNLVYPSRQLNIAQLVSPELRDSAVPTRYQLRSLVTHRVGQLGLSSGVVPL